MFEFFLARCRRWTGFVVESHMKYIRGPDFSSVLVRMEYIPLGGGLRGVSLKCQEFLEEGCSVLLPRFTIVVFVF